MQSPKSFLGQNASSQYKKITSSLVNNSSSSTTMQASKFEGNSFRLMLLTLMVLQNSATVLVGRYTRSSVPKEEMFIVGNFVLTTEFTKLILSAMLEQYTGNSIIESIKVHVFARPLDFLKISIPAILYLVQNTLLYVALSNLSAPLFQVTYQGKLLTTALVSVVLLNRRYNMKQWICLTTLGFGVAAVVLGETKAKDDAPQELNDQNMIVGLIAVSISCLSSALAGVYFEKVLKKVSNDDDSTIPPPSLWMRNVQLAFFSVVVAYLKRLGSDDEDNLLPFFHGFNNAVWILVACQAGGGLLVAAVIKYADNVLKGLATGVAVVVSTICSMILFDTPLTLQFTAGAAVILTSVYGFSNDFPCLKKPSPDSETEMKPMLPR